MIMRDDPVPQLHIFFILNITFNTVNIFSLTIFRSHLKKLLTLIIYQRNKNFFKLYLKVLDT
ncbi:hypothetical protein BME99_14050 [Pseudomonas protegens]|nr:hypothetical protein BME99_14050 [Pseudomonas protegens]